MQTTRYRRNNWFDQDLGAFRAAQEEPHQGRDRQEMLRALLTHALQEDLTPRQREILLLYHGRGLTMTEIAGRLQVDRTTVSRTLRRGEARVRRCLLYSRRDRPRPGGDVPPRAPEG